MERGGGKGEPEVHLTTSSVPLSFDRFQGILEYEGPLNPTRNNNPYVFLLFRQPGTVTLDEKWKTVLSKRNWEAELGDFIEEHNLKGWTPPLQRNFLHYHCRRPRRCPHRRCLPPFSILLRFLSLLLFFLFLLLFFFCFFKFVLHLIRVLVQYISVYRG